MIITRAPLRISFAGGGTDLPAFYREDTGAVFSATITAYMYLSVNRKFDGAVRVGYSQTENVERVDDLKHDLARETLKYCGVERGIEVVSVADVPAGTGLGSSSAYAVALLQALRGGECDRATLASEACEIEIGKCGHPIGKQDQHAAAYGGLRLYEFAADGVKVFDSIYAPQLEDHLLLFYLGRTRDGNGILKDQLIDRTLYREMAELARVLLALARMGNLAGFASAMDAAWKLKRRVAYIDAGIDDLVTLAKQHGAQAGKLCGAGGTGFLLLLVSPERQNEVRECMKEYRELPFRFESRGSQIIYGTD